MSGCLGQEVGVGGGDCAGAQGVVLGCRNVPSFDCVVVFTLYVH